LSPQQKKERAETGSLLFEVLYTAISTAREISLGPLSTCKRALDANLPHLILEV